MATFLGINNLLLISPQVSVDLTSTISTSHLLDIAGLRHIDHVLRYLLRCARQRHGRIVYGPNGIEDRRKDRSRASSPNASPSSLVLLGNGPTKTSTRIEHVCRVCESHSRPRQRRGIDRAHLQTAV